MNIKNYKPEEALKIILAVAEDYHNVLDGKNYMIVYYENKELKCKLLSFNGANFCHLTGSKTKVTPTQFYKLCLDGKLSIKDFEAPKGIQNLKLTALPFLSKIFFNGCSIGNFLKSGINLESDYFVGNTRKISIGFVAKKIYDIPRSLLCRDIREITNPTIKVEAIFRKEKNDCYFSDYTYCHKNFDISLVSSCKFATLIQNPRDYRVKQLNVTLDQIATLKNANVPFGVQKISEDNFTIVYDRLIKAKVQEILDNIPLKQQINNKPKR